MKASSRFCKNEPAAATTTTPVLHFNICNVNDGPQNQLMDWIFSPFLGESFGFHKLEALLSLFDPENLQTALVNWVLRDARASLIHRWLRSSLNRWWAEGCCAGNSPFSTIFEACRRCNSLESAFCLATTVADVLKQEQYHHTASHVVGQDDTIQWLKLLRQLRVCMEMEEWQSHDIVDLRDHQQHVPQLSDCCSADDAWQDWINSARNAESLDPTLIDDGPTNFFTPPIAQFSSSLVSLLSYGEIWQPSPILLACHRARWLSTGLLHDGGGLSLSVAHLDILASMPYKGTIQLAGAIACGIWEGIILPEGSKGLAEVLHLRIHGGDVKEDKSSSNNNKNGLLTLIKMLVGVAIQIPNTSNQADRLLGHLHYFSTPLEAKAACDLIRLEEENQQKNSCAFLPTQDVFIHQCIGLPNPSTVAISIHQSMLQALLVCLSMDLELPDLNLLFGKEVGPLLLSKDSLNDSLPFEESYSGVKDISVLNNQEELIKKAFKSSGGNLSASMVYKLAKGFGYNEAFTRKLHIRLLLEEGHDTMAEDVMALASHHESDALVEEVMKVARQRLKFALPLIPLASLAAMDADIVEDIINSPDLKNSSGSLTGLLGILRTSMRILFQMSSGGERKVHLEQLYRFCESVIEALSQF